MHLFITPSTKEFVRRHAVLTLPLVVFGTLVAVNVGMAAFTEPPVAPPGGNPDVPVNTGGAGQSKSGGLILNTGGAANGLIVEKGNVGIGAPGPNGKLHVWTQANPNALVVDAATGHVGITATPDSGNGARLKVGGSVVIENNSTYSAYDAAGTRRILIGADSTDHVLVGDSVAWTDIRFHPGGPEAMRIMRSGNVGIGTASPGAKLDVAGVGVIANGLAVNSAGAANGLLVLNGKVGIGTANPISNVRLTVDAPGGTVPLSLSQQGAFSGTPAFINFRSGTRLDYVAEMGIYSARGDVRLQGYNGIALTVGDASVGNLGAYIAPSGNVGIGTVNPQAKVQVTDGDVYVQTQGKGIILRDTNGSGCHRVTVNAAGALSADPVTCP